MLKSDTPELKVLEYSQALQRTQNLESRGDLQNKGIYKLLMTAYEWSEKFLSNKSLPTFDHLLRELGFEEEKLTYFVLEYAIRSNPPLFRKLNYIDYLATGSGNPYNPGSHLRHYTVFCRPTSADGSTCYRYVTGLNDVSVAAIKKWIQEKRILIPKEERKDFIFRSIDSNKLLDTYASTELGNLFHCDYDRTKKLRDVTLVIHIKPILKKLVDEKLVFYLRNENASKPGNKSVFYYFNKEEIFDRLDIYMDYIKEKIVPDLVRLGVINEPDDEDYIERKNLVETILSYMNDSYGDQKAVVEEILLLNDFYNAEMEKVEEERKKQNLQELMDYIKASGKIMNLHQLKIDGETLTEDSKSYLLNDPNILYTEYADKLSYYEYILHKINISPAIESAIQHYNATGKDSEITILRFMGALDELDNPGLIATFEEAESRTLFPYLPFFTWIWRWIVGNRTVEKHEAEMIRDSLRQGIQTKIKENRKNFISLEKQKNETGVEDRQSKGKLQKKSSSLAGARKEFLEEGGGSHPSSKANGSPGSELPDNFTLGEEDNPETKEKLKKIQSYLNEAWDFGHYPDRNYLMEKLEHALSEDELIRFIKKNAGKDIYSFMIRNQIEKYPFPILVTRDYLKKNGSRILADAERIIQEQKSRAMPEQLKYDTAVSLAEFLDRVLPKIK